WRHSRPAPGRRQEESIESCTGPLSGRVCTLLGHSRGTGSVWTGAGNLRGAARGGPIILGRDKPGPTRRGTAFAPPCGAGFMPADGAEVVHDGNPCTVG